MLNVVAIMGRLTADPEMRTTTNGVSVTSFTLAVDRSYTKQGEERQADFIECVAWRGTAEFICKYFTKGRLMAVDGSIQTRNYEDKNGNKRKSVEIVANNVSFAGDSRRDGNGGGSSYESAPLPSEPPAFNEPAAAYSSGSNDDFTEVLGDDLPF